MSDKYYRGLRNLLNDTKYKLQLASMNLRINENKNNISGIKNDISGINNFSDKINDISTNSDQINTNKNSISSNLEEINNINSLLATEEIFKKTYSITNQSFKFNSNIIYFELLEIEIENNFNKDGKLEFDSDIYYKYKNLQLDHHRLQHEYRILDDEDNLLYKIILDKTYSTDLDFDTNIMLVKSNSFITFKNNYNKIKIILDLYRVYRHGAGEFDLELINENFINIVYLDKNDIPLKINTNENNISSNLSKIEDNNDDIDEIKLNLNNIKNDLSDFKINYSIQNLFIYNIDVERNYTLNSDNPEFSIFSYNLEDNFKSNSILEVNCKILYNYATYNNIGTLIHIFKLYDKNNILLHEYKNLKSNSGDNLSAYLSQNDLFYVELNDNYSIIKIELFLSILDNITKSVTVKLLNTFKSNFLYIKHYIKINTLSVNNNLTDLENDILSNKSNISTNLIKINSNEDDILYNLNEINYIENDKSTQYLKNIYNILIYESKTQIDFIKDIFYEKVFDVNANINDFIEIFFKIELEYQDTDDQNYIKSIYELFDENNNSLYIKSVNNNNYTYFSNKMTIDENIFYNFTKNVEKLKFVIKFQKLSSSRVVKIWYIKNDNNRLIIKHFGN